MVEPRSAMDQYLPIFAAARAGRPLRRACPSSRRACSARASSPTAAKLAPYECGIVPDREPPQRFPVRFYLVAMIFIIFDIEIVFLYPWAVDLPAAHDRSGSSRCWSSPSSCSSRSSTW